MERPFILLVEDHPDTRDMYAFVLRMAGFEVREATNGEEGIRILDSQAPSLVITDLRMPGNVTGQELCRQFRRAGVSVLVITAAAPHEQNEPRDLGCTIVAKPFTPDQLLTEVRRLLPSDLQIERG
jgi:DNA-binding response OmpR family regulator